MIRCVTGANGSGKSVLLSELIARHPLPCITNLRLTSKHPRVKDTIYVDDSEIACDRGCCGVHVDPRFHGRHVVIDEADIFFHAYDYLKLNRYFIFFKQHRKRGSDITLCVQDSENLWAAIRRLVREVYVCRRDVIQDVPFGLRSIYPSSWLLWHRELYQGFGGIGFLSKQTLTFRDAALWFPTYLTGKFHDKSDCILTDSERAGVLKRFESERREYVAAVRRERGLPA